MKLLLLGASGRAGNEVLAAALTRGDEVTSLGRSAPKRPGARHVTGDVADPAAVAGVLDGQDAVLSCLASTNDDPVCSRATRAVIRAADGRPVRYLVIGGAGVDVPGDRKGVPDKLVGLLMRIVARGMLADRQAEHALLEASPLAYTMLRPPRLTAGAPAGAWTFTFDKPASHQLDRADLAGAMLESVGRPDHHRRAPFVAGARARA